MPEDFEKIIKYAVGFILFIIILSTRPVTKIDSSERGIVRRWGAVQDKILREGLHITLPFADDVEVVSLKPSSYTIDVPVNSQGAITKDNQTIGADLVVFYKFNEADILKATKQYGFEILKEKLKKDAVESFKQVVGSYTIFDVAQKQEEIRAKTLSGVVAKLGAYPIIVDDIKVSNYDWSDEFDNQIALTMKIAQEAKQSEQSLKKVEIDAQKRVKEAEANKQAEVLNAEAQKIKGEGIAAYNAAITSNSKNMEFEIQLKKLEIEKIKAEKWNGAYVSNNNYLPIPYNYGGVQGK